MTLGALFREGNVVQVVDAISVNDSNTEGWQIQDEAFLELQRNMKEIRQQIFIENCGQALLRHWTYKQIVIFVLGALLVPY